MTSRILTIRLKVSRCESQPKTLGHTGRSDQSSALCMNNTDDACLGLICLAWDMTTPKLLLESEIESFILFFNRKEKTS